MIKKRTFFLLAFCCFGLVTHVCSQQTQITRADFIEASKASFIKSWELSRRLKIRKEYYADDKLMKVETTITEAVPPSKWHTVTEIKIGEKVNLIELISIGEDRYSRKDNGEWQKGGNGFGSGSGTNNTQSEQFTVEKTTFNNQKIKIYESISIYLNSAGQKAYFKTTKWINNNNLLIKVEDENGLMNPPKLPNTKLKFTNTTQTLKLKHQRSMVMFHN